MSLIILFCINRWSESSYPESFLWAQPAANPYPMATCHPGTQAYILPWPSLPNLTVPWALSTCYPSLLLSPQTKQLQIPCQALISPQLLGEGSRSLGPSVSPRTWVLVWLLNDSATTPSGSDRVCLLHKCGVCRWASFRVCPYVCISVCFMSVYTSVYTHWCVEMSFCPHA